MTNRINQFLQLVTSHIRSKEARQFVSEELKQHLQSTASTYVHKGMSKEEAEQRAIQEMGSPVTLGQSLNKVHKPKIDWFLISLVTAILFISFLPTLGSSHFITNKVIYSFISICIIVSLMFFDVRKLQKYGYVFYWIGLLLLVLLHFSNSTINGRAVFYYTSLFRLDIFMTIPFFYIGWASLLSNKKVKLWHYGVLFFVSALLFANLASLPTLFIYIIMVFVMFWHSPFSYRIKLWITIAFISMISFIGVLVASFGRIQAYQLDRLYGFLTPDIYTDGSGYIYLQLQQSFANAGWLGTKLPLPLSEAHTDLVFANLVQYYGYLMGSIIVIVFILCIIRIVTIAFTIRDSFGKLLITGSLAYFATHTIYNIGMTLGLVPIISISLPFISYGFSPTIMSSFIIGIVLSIYRRKSLLMTKIHS